MEYLVNNSEVVRYLAFGLAVLFFVIAIVRFVFKRSPKGYIVFCILAIICVIVGCLTQIVEKNEEKVETRFILEKNYKDYVPMDGNTFYWNGKVYEYKLSKNKTELIIKSKESGAENATAYDLEEVK